FVRERRGDGTRRHARHRVPGSGHALAELLHPKEWSAGESHSEGPRGQERFDRRRVRADGRAGVRRGDESTLDQQNCKARGRGERGPVLATVLRVEPRPSENGCKNSDGGGRRAGLIRPRVAPRAEVAEGREERGLADSGQGGCLSAQLRVCLLDQLALLRVWETTTGRLYSPASPPLTCGKTCSGSTRRRPSPIGTRRWSSSGRRSAGSRTKS